MAQAEIKAVITAEDRASSVIGGFGSSLGHLGKLAAIGMAAAGAAVAAFGAIAVHEFAESEDAAAQLGAVLKSTGGVAGVTADAANNLASSLQRVTRFSDEAILGGENLLLTFTNISKDIFPQATEVMLDMSTALGQDVKASAIQLGKALQDPILGVTALRRVGVNFNEAQTEVIKKLVETGRAGEAQALILKELQTEFGGSAKAAGQTFAGSLDRLKNQFSDLMETIGGGIAAALSPFIQKFLDFVTNHQPEIVAAFNQIGAVLGFLYNNFLVPIFTWLGEQAPGILAFFTAAWNAIKPALEGLWQTIQTQLWPALQELWTVLQPYLPMLGTALVAAIIAFVVALTVAIGIIGGVIKAIAEMIKWGQNLNSGFRDMVHSIGAFFSSLPGMAAGAVNGIVDWFAQLPHRIMSAIGGIGGAIKNSIGGIQIGGRALRDIVPGFAEGVQNFGGGMALVGERGPELVNLPRGSSVIPNNKMGGSVANNTTININVGLMTGSAIERRDAAQKMFEDLKDIASSRGQTVAQMINQESQYIGAPS